MAHWLYRLHGGQYGPTTQDQIEQLIKRKEISEHTELWTEAFGEGNWRRLQDISEFANVSSNEPSEQVWHYVKGGKSIGPIAREDIVKAREQSKIDDLTPVWRQAAEAGWTPYGESELATRNREAQQSRPPPPIPANHIRNQFAWIMALSPIFGAAIQAVVNTETLLGKNHLLYVVLLYFLCNSILVSLDLEQIKHSGRTPDNIGLGKWFWFIPLFLFKRYRVLKQSSHYFWTSVACLIGGLAIPSAAGAPGIFALINVPVCEDEIVVSKVKEIVGQMPLAIHLNINVTQLTNIRQIRESDDKRYCRGTVQTTIGTQSNVIYNIQGSAFHFYVQVEPTF